MKVLIVNQHVEDGIGGSEIQCDIVASHLTKFGHDVTYGIVDARKKTYNVDYDWVPIKRRSFWLHFGRALKSIKPDVVYWRFNKKHLLTAVLLSRYYGVRFVFKISSIPDTKRWIPIDKRVFRKPWGIVSVLKIAKALVRYAGWSLKNAWDYNGFCFVDAVVCQKDDNIGKLPAKTQVLILDSALTTCKPFLWDRPFVVWVANLKLIKNPEKFIELAANFQEQNIDFLMIGAVQKAKYDYILDKARLPNNLHYLGVKTPEEVNGIIRSSLFLVHTCDPEGFSNNLIQAWSQGKPTISLYFDPDGIITKNQIGFLSGTMQKMIEDTEKLITNETLRNSMGKRARDFSVARFSPELNVKKLEKLLLSVVGNSQQVLS